MFENPDCLLVLQELSMEILCNVVVELKRERKVPKADKDKDKHKDKDKERGPSFDGQEGLADVTVFDFAEILYKTAVFPCCSIPLGQSWLIIMSTGTLFPVCFGFY
jgi:hypothetical protein